MALEGAQGGDAPADRERAAESRPDPVGAAAAADLNPRRQRRSQSFAYETKAFQGENLTYAILTQPSQGWVTNNGDGTFSFDPGLDFRDLNPGDTRRISFSYQVSDGWSGTETETTTLAVTGTPEGTLSITVTASNPGRGAAPPRTAPAADRASTGGALSERPAIEPAETVAGTLTPGFADDPLDAPGMAGAAAESALHRDEARAAPGAGPADGERAGIGGPGVERTVTVPAMESWEPGPEEAPETSDLEPKPETRDPLAYGAGAGPYRDDGLTPDNEEGQAAADLEASLLAEPEVADPGLSVPAKPPLEAEGNDFHDEPDATGLEPGPVEPEPGPVSDGRRYAILAQPSDGRVTAKDDGRFDFAPGAGFPDLAVGELEQVSFTCEATDADGAKSIVIASLTVAGTSDGPEVCDVTYRQAQGQGTTPHTTAGADHGLFGADPHEVEAHPAHGLNQWPEPPAPDLAMDHDASEDLPRAHAVAEPSHSAFPAAGGVDDAEHAGPLGWAPTAETPSAAPASPSWQPDTVAEASSLGQDPQSGAGRSADPDEVPGTFGQAIAPAAEPPTDGAAATDGSQSLAEREPHGERQVEPAAWQLAPEIPPEAAAMPLPHQDGQASSESRLGSDTEPENEPFAEPSIPSGGGETAAMPGLYGEPQAEQPAMVSAEDDDRSESRYRGAVAAEALTTLLPEHSDAEADERPEAVSKPEAVVGDLPPEPAGPDISKAADVALEAGATELDELFGATGAGEQPADRGPDPLDDGPPMGGDDRDPIGSSFAARTEPAFDAPPAAGPEATADDAQALRVSDAFLENADGGSAGTDDATEESALAPVDVGQIADAPAELSDFVLSQNTVVEKSEVGTVVGQVLVDGADQGSRFIFDLQNDAGGRFDINPRTGQITVADGALLDRQAANSHDILVQVIAHSGVSCRKGLTIRVLPSDADQVADPPPAAPEEIDTPAPEGVDAGRPPALRSETGIDGEALVGTEIYRPDDSLVGGSAIDTLHLDGVSGGPGHGGWALELDQGEIVETNDDNLVLSENSAGIVVLDGCPVKVAFEGIERIEW